MKRNIVFILLISLIVNPSFSQVNLKGILLKGGYGLSKGDRVIVTGAKISNSDTIYYIKSSHYMTSSKNHEFSLPANKIKIIDNDLSFWDNIWFFYRYVDVKKNGWDIKKRKELEKMILDYIAQLEQDNLIFKDLYIEDYLLGLIKKIHPLEFNKGQDQYFMVKILNSEEEKLYAFDNGSILISTQLIANASSEEELMKKLAQAVAHVILDHSYENVSIFYEDILHQLGVVYNKSMDQTAKRIAENFIDHYKHECEPGNMFLDDKDYLEKISGIVSYTAWQDYYSNDFFNSLKRLNRLTEYDLATKEDYLLKAKLYRMLSPNNEALQSALGYITKAEEMGKEDILDIYPEKGLILIKMNKRDEALTIFEKYREILIKQEKAGDELKWCNQMIAKCKGNLVQN